ncbi:acyltransferase-domain-containing protein [Fennellomyces sp. T-0311]|nr:acyltransferase-domain-containing protein [Fennellomyces sp. T-0311]
MSSIRSVSEAIKAVGHVVFLFGMAGTLQVVQVSSFLLRPFSERLLIQINSRLVGLVWTVMQHIFERRQKAHITFSGDRIPHNESAIVISNHRSWTDFYMLHSVAIRRNMLSNCKYFVKDSLKWLPFFGWGMWLADFLFVRRDWTRDQRRIERTFASIKRLHTPVWIMSFAEGTRFTHQKLKECQMYASQHGYSIMHNVLLPRTRGFVACVNGFRNSHVKYIYDFTIAYNHRLKGNLEEFNVAPDMVRLHVRHLADEYQFHVNVKRFAIKDLPDNDEQLAAWLRKRYVEKDRFLSTLRHGWIKELDEEVWEEKW